MTYPAVPKEQENSLKRIVRARACLSLSTRGKQMNQRRLETHVSGTHRTPIIMSLFLLKPSVCRDAEKIEGFPQVIEPVRLTLRPESDDEYSTPQHTDTKCRYSPILIESLSLSENDDVKELS